MDMYELLDALSKALTAKSSEVYDSVRDIPNASSIVLANALSRATLLKDISDVLDEVKASI